MLKTVGPTIFQVGTQHTPALNVLLSARHIGVATTCPRCTTCHGIKVPIIRRRNDVTTLTVLSHLRHRAGTVLTRTLLDAGGPFAASIIDEMYADITFGRCLCHTTSNESTKAKPLVRTRALVNPLHYHLGSSIMLWAALHAPQEMLNERCPHSGCTPLVSALVDSSDMTLPITALLARVPELNLHTRCANDPFAVASAWLVRNRFQECRNRTAMEVVELDPKCAERYPEAIKEMKRLAALYPADYANRAFQMIESELMQVCINMPRDLIAYIQEYAGVSNSIWTIETGAAEAAAAAGAGPTSSTAATPT